MNENIIYRNRKIYVSDKLFRTPRRSYRISDIEKITLKRSFFLMCLPLALGSFFLLQEYEPYLYDVEKAVCAAMFTLVPIACWFIGTLSVTSKSYKDDDAITGFMPTLIKAREAIESVIFANPDSIPLLEANHDEQ